MGDLWWRSVNLSLPGATLATLVWQIERSGLTGVYISIIESVPSGIIMDAQNIII